PKLMLININMDQLSGSSGEITFWGIFFGASFCLSAFLHPSKALAASRLRMLGAVLTLPAK
ncbi:hypothetical protein, partial [Sutterella wadsworthensis]|uniref:hypothetical protein n=1 Tax=Sutterella wadsworthensis TaxID=40545 RepID=UPI00265A34BF